MEGSKGRAIEVDHAPQPRAAEVRVPEAFVRCKPPMMGLNTAPTSGTLLWTGKRKRQASVSARNKGSAGGSASEVLFDGLDTEADRHAACREEVDEIDGL